MTTLDFITALFCQVDDHLPGIPKHPHATLWPSEIVTLGMLHALKGGGNRAFSRWFPPRERGVANGVLFLGSRTGGMLSAPIALLLIRTIGWRESFAVFGVLGQGGADGEEADRQDRHDQRLRSVDQEVGS